MMGFLRMLIVVALFVPSAVHASGVGYCDISCQVRGSEVIVIGTVTEVVAREEWTNTYRVRVQEIFRGVPSREILVRAYSKPEPLCETVEGGFTLCKSGESWIHHVFREGQRVGLMLLEEEGGVYPLHLAQSVTDPDEVRAAVRLHVYRYYGVPLFLVSAIAFVGSLVTLLISAIGRHWRPKSARWKKIFRVARAIFIVATVGIGVWVAWGLSIRLR